MTATIGASAQVIIDKTSAKITATAGASLEFGDNQGKGIVLPYVSTIANNPAGYPEVVTHEPGTLIMDLATKQVKVHTKSGWFNLSNNAATSVAIPTGIQDNKTELPKAKVSIGKPAVPAIDGVLVLEDSNKAMILPLESSYKNVKSPAAGMIVFDTTENLFCAFNGTEWSFWAGQ